jgi:CrcB protein
MTWLPWAGVAILGGFGALARFALTLLVADRLPPHLPVGTLAVNLSGSFLLGLLAGAAVAGDARLILGAGALGSYTTFSTWMVETQRIEEVGRRGVAGANLVLGIVLGLAAAALGHALGAQL